MAYSKIKPNKVNSRSKKQPYMVEENNPSYSTSQLEKIKKAAVRERLVICLIENPLGSTKSSTDIIDAVENLEEFITAPYRVNNKGEYSYIMPTSERE